MLIVLVEILAKRFPTFIQYYGKNYTDYIRIKPLRGHKGLGQILSKSTRKCPKRRATPISFFFTFTVITVFHVWRAPFFKKNPEKLLLDICFGNSGFLFSEAVSNLL